MDWVQDELARLRVCFPDLKFESSGNWVLMESYELPDGWNRSKADVVFRIPAGLPGEAPYAFWIRDGIKLASGVDPGNYAFPSDAIPFPPDSQWGKFSWNLDPWAPGHQPGAGTGMVNFAYSIANRLRELS